MWDRLRGRRSRDQRVRHFCWCRGFRGLVTILGISVSATTSAGADVYSFQWDRPPGFDGLAGPIFADDSAGALNSLTLSYDSDDERLTLLAAFAPEPGSGNLPDGFSLVLNNGPSPAGEPGRYAVLHFKTAPGTMAPLLSAYAYNGMGKDGVGDSDWDLPDRIITSGHNPDWVHWASVVDEADERVLSFDIDVSGINSHDPRYGDSAEWFGIGFDETIGMWLTPYDLQSPWLPDPGSYEMDPGPWWMGAWRWGRGFGPFVERGFFDFANQPANTNVNIPEPATLGLIGLCGIALLGRDRKGRR